MEAKVAKTLLEAYASVYERSEHINEQAYTDPKYAERPQGVPYKDLRGFTPSAFKDQKQYPAVYQGKKGMVSGDEGARGRGFRIDPEDYDRAVKQIELNKKSKPTSGRGAGRATFNQNNSYEPEGELVDETIRPDRPYDGPKVKSGPPKKKPMPHERRPIKVGLPMEREDVDVFDIVKGYLMTEHDLTEEQAMKVMLELEDEHRDAILEAYVVTLADKRGNTKAYQNYLKGMKNQKTGEPLYKAAPHLKGV